MNETITFTIDGKVVTVDVKLSTRLSDVLRDQFGLLGQYSTCNAGYCGACTVQIDERAQAACQIMAVQAHGMEIVTEINALKHAGERDEDA